MYGEGAVDDVPERLSHATIRLLAEQDPSAIKARTVTAAAGLSTMVVYSQLGGVPVFTRRHRPRPRDPLGSVGDGAGDR